MDCRLKLNKTKNRCKQLKKINGIPKKDLKWFQAKLKYPNLSPKGNADGDNHKNKKDCRPFDKKRHKEDWDLPDYGDSNSLSVSPKEFQLFNSVRHGADLGKDTMEIRRYLKERGYQPSEISTGIRLYEQNMRGRDIRSYAGLE